MNARYIDAERKLAVAMDWTDTDYNGPVGDWEWPVTGILPGALERSSIPTWARSNDACVSLMIEHSCFVGKEVASDGQPVMVARWSDQHGFGERLAVPIAEHVDAETAFRYAAVLGVTAKVEAESRARAVADLVSA
jgi:hypothetical protein